MSKGDPVAKTIQELESSPQISAKDLRETLEEYAEKGNPIGDGFVRLIQKTVRLDEEDVRVLRIAALQGIRSQNHACTHTVAIQYRVVREYLEDFPKQIVREKN
ncbi:MAG: hypothetical protein PHV42_00200 [Candidatus Pacebacteria bacterium]|nr:hypothetical protein [Candidatus Paceibacterota bacterium]